jgi:hypothetical protein
MLLRTAKSCGPDAPTLASSSRMASRPYRARTSLIFRKRRWQKSPVTEESTKETVKTIACGNARCSGVLVVNTRVRSTTTKCTRGYGCSGHPAFPTPSTGRKIHQRLGRFASRGREAASEIGAVIARSTCDEAIHPSFARRDGLLRFARNDGSTPGLSVAV